MRLIFGDIIERNISFRVLQSLFLVVIVVGFIDFLFFSLNEFSDLDHNYSFEDVFHYALLSTPYRLYDLSSYFCLIAVILGLGSLNDQGELIATRVLGKSNTSIALAAFRPIFLLMALGLVASEFYIPELSQTAEENRLLKKNILPSNKGYWFASDSRITFFKSAPSRKAFKGITVFELDDDFKPHLIVSSDEAYIKDKKIILRNPNKVSQDIDSLKEDANNGNFTLDQHNMDFSSLLAPKYLSLTELYVQKTLNISEYRRNQLSLEFWRKLLQPLVTLSLLLLALSFLFGPMRDQKSGQRILLAIVTAFLIDLSQKLLASVSIISVIPVFLAVLLPVIIISIVALIFLKKTT